VLLDTLGDSAQTLLSLMWLLLRIRGDEFFPQDLMIPLSETFYSVILSHLVIVYAPAEREGPMSPSWQHLQGLP
jgi:hypothetical protein